MIINLFSKSFVIFFILIAVINLSACRKEEQGRPLNYNKGVYQGNADASLTVGTVYQLRKRISGQAWY